MPKPWTDQDYEFLRKNFKDTKKCAAVLGRTEEAIRRKRGILGLQIRSSHVEWTQEMDDFIKGNYVTLGADKCAEILNVSRHALQARATKKLGVKHYSCKLWTKKEIRILKTYYEQYGGGVLCAAMLKGRSLYSVNKKAQELGLKCKASDRYELECGYVALKVDGKVILEHRKVMEDYLGRKLTSDEIVHHIDGNKSNNEITNLVITNRATHIEEHRSELEKGRKRKLKINTHL
jgi:hypothetical protein